METIQHTDRETGRMYEAFQAGDEVMIIGPKEGLVDSLDYPEPFATKLHNVLYRRRIFSYADATRPNVLIGALQEALNIDAQRLAEKYLTFEKEVVT